MLEVKCIAIKQSKHTQTQLKQATTLFIYCTHMIKMKMFISNGNFTAIFQDENCFCFCFGFSQKKKTDAQNKKKKKSSNNNNNYKWMHEH